MAASRSSDRAPHATSAMNLRFRHSLALLRSPHLRPGRCPLSRRRPAQAASADCVVVGDLEHLAVVRRGHAHQPGAPDAPIFRCSSFRRSATTASASSSKASKPGLTAVRERRAHLQPGRDAGLRPRVLQSQRSAERDRHGRFGPVFGGSGNPPPPEIVDQSGVPGRPPPHDLSRRARNGCSAIAI